MVDAAYKIEVVCAGNLARSPMAEAVGNGYLAERKLTDRLEIVSSGVTVSAALEFPKLQRFIALADRLPEAERFSRTPEESVLIDGIIHQDGAMQKYARDGEYREVVLDFAQRSRGDLRRVGRAQRDAVLTEVGLQCRSEMTQTILRPDVSLVLGLDSKVASAARFIYKGGVQIDTLGGYVGSEPDIEDPIGIMDLSVYRALRDSLAIDLRKAVDRFALINELGRP